ncbi:Molybdate transporter of MFS superfamily protein [Halogranum amylolyticum]|uniref:Molybdate transporter of MFS superfamily protein n=1 Tax=Halogranum amylolyticum TaxID=660520 RepID=A0A1H8TNM9_9EURY|nr:putative sulfate/molybdate transporter [Halogranum amylolyticum]SEO92660.1 Molybdate transporter of MFS superfamily protein [Halogranum amylolyticum]
MAISVGGYGDRELQFSVDELTGALGDSVTVLPLVVALGALTPVSLPHVLLLFGVFQIVWGVVYGLPLSVEPMKALVGLTVAGAISYPELAAAGLLAGGVLLLTGTIGVLSRIERYVGTPVVRGVQLAVALLLAQAGLELGVGDPALAVLALLLTLAVAALGYRRSATLVVLGVGVVLAAVSAGIPAPSLPSPTLFPAGAPRLSTAAVEASLGQLAMTVGNAAVATSLLCADLFDTDVESDDLATSMGSMSLLSVPLGGLPMCHGSGGLAGKYAFGARTGGANLILGALYLLAALVAGLVTAFPLAVLGVLLVVVAVQLARSATETTSLPLTVAVGLTGLLVNVGVAFVGGVVVHQLVSRR